MKQNKQHWITLGMWLSMVILHGCANLQTYPQVARAGDTISMTLGTADKLTRAGTTVEFVSDSDPGTTYDLTNNIRALFRLYADKTSSAIVDQPGSWLPDMTGHEPWMNVMMLDLPGGLPPGTGKITVTPNSEAQFPLQEPPPEMDIEIIAGTGKPNSFSYWQTFGGPRIGDLSRLEPKPQVVVRPPVPPGPWGFQGCGTSRFGAVEVNLNIPTALIASDGTTSLGPVPDDQIRLLVEDLRGEPTGSGILTTSQVQMFWTRTGDDFRVMFISPTGMTKCETRFAMILVRINLTGNDPQFSQAISPTLTSIDYYDLDGFLTTGPTPAVSLE